MLSGIPSYSEFLTRFFTKICLPDPFTFHGLTVLNGRGTKRSLRGKCNSPDKQLK